MQEKRKPFLAVRADDPKASKKEVKATIGSTPVPKDFLQMVEGIFTTNFSQGLSALKKFLTDPKFTASGFLYGDEIVLTISLGSPGVLAATTVHASVDFDPNASRPTAQELLGTCVDALGQIVDYLLNPSDPSLYQKIAEHSLSALEDIPFEWTGLKVGKRSVFVKVDKSNPSLEDAADEFLKSKGSH